MPAYAVEWAGTAIAARKSLSPQSAIAAVDIVETLASQAGNGQDPLASARDLVERDLPTKISITYDRDVQRRVIRVTHVAQPQVPVPPRIFISYSHIDKQWLDEFRPFLAALEEQQMLNVWDDTRLTPGDAWLPEIMAALRESRAVVFLVTVNLLASPFIIRTEVAAALEEAKTRGCTLLWIHVRDSPWMVVPVFKMFQALHLKPPLALIPKLRRDSAWTQIVYGVVEAIGGPRVTR
jgi:hypothetical protein